MADNPQQTPAQTNKLGRVNQDKMVVGLGYNKMPNGCEDQMPWSKDQDAAKLDTKYIYVCHAVLNAIMNKNSADLKGCSIYVTLFPCNECAKLIIQAGMKEVVYLSDKYHHLVGTQAAKRMFKQAKIPFRVFEPKPDVVLELRSFCEE